MTFKSPYPLILIFFLVALGTVAIISSSRTHAAADDPDSLLLPRTYLPFLSKDDQTGSEAPVIISTPPLSATVGISYTYDVNATGIPTPTFSLIVTPGDMTIDNISGLVQWTPTISGTYSVTVRAGNDIPPAAEQPFVIEAVNALAGPVITSTPPPTATVGISYTYDVNATGIPTPTFSLVVAPSNMIIDGISGLIQWTPTASGTYFVTVGASNGITPTVEQPFMIQVEGPPRLPGRKWDPRLDQRFASLTEASAEPGEGYWRLIKAQWLDEEETKTIGPDHHILMDVLDENGQRLTDVRIIITNGGATPVFTQDKQEVWAADFPMSNVVAPAYSARPDTGAPADRINGMGLGSLEAPNFTHHASYFLVWQWTIAPP